MPDPIQPIAALASSAAPTGLTRPGGAAGGAASFGELLGSAIDDLSRLSAGSDRLAEAFAAGADVEIHEVMVAMQETQIAFELAAQVRNRAVDAYQEIMRLQL